MLKEVFWGEKKKYTILASGIIVLVFLLLLAFILISTSKLNRTTFYAGMHIGDIDVSGMTQAEAREAVSIRYQDAMSQTIILSSGDHLKDVYLPNLSAELDLAASIEQAYSVGRTGNLFHRLNMVNTIKKEGFVSPPILSCDDVMLETVIGELALLIDIPETKMQVVISDNEMTVTRGKPGKRIILEKAIARFKTEALTAPNGKLSLEPENIIPKEPNIDDLYATYCGDPVNASYKIENQKLIITEEKDGVMFNKADAQKILDEAMGDTIRIPVVVTPAEINVEQVKSELFPTLLSRYSSSYNAGDVSRSHNVALASEKINEVVLAPGDVFSYNDTVGPRTIDRGFRTANVYVGNKVEPGIGGGICQVSSTLFNAVVLADLKIVYRTNHSLPVSYVPLGRDATVSYGSIDFKFANNTSAPIKIVASASGGRNIVSIYGVKENPGRTIEISTQHISTIPSKLVQKEDPELPAGTINVEQAGSNGSTYNTYKITKENGAVVKNELLTKSTYVPTDRIEIIGTQAVDTGAEPAIPTEGDTLPQTSPSATPSPATPATATPPIPAA